MLFYSKKTEYAVQIMVVIGKQDNGSDYVSLETIRHTADVPKALSFKILNTLVKQGLLGSTLGPKGGFRLAKPSSKIWLKEIIAPFEPEKVHESCALGLPQCSEQNKCSLHDQWKDLRQPLIDFLNSATLQNLVDQTDPKMIKEAFPLL